MNYTFEILKRDEIEEVASLLSLVFKGGYQKFLNKTRLAFENSRSCVIVVKYNKKIVGTLGGYEWPLLFNDLKISAIQLINTGVHPNHTRKGLFSKLNLEYLEYASKQNIDYIYILPNKISKIGYDKLGWEYENDFHRLTFYNNPLKFIKNRQDETTSVRLKIESSKECGLIDDSLLEARKDQFKDTIHTNYSKDFIKWRLSNSEENYRVFQKDGVYVVYKIIQTNKMKSLVFGEFFLMKDSRTLFSSTIKEITKLEKPDISYTCISRSHPYFSYYLFNLFMPSPLNFNLNFGTRLISSDKEKNLSGKKWATSYLDTDTF